MGETSNLLNKFIEDNELLRKANELAYRYMSVIKRQEAGKTMYNHVFDVAKNVFEIGIKDVEIIAAALLHDIIEDSEKSIKKDPSLKEPITKEYLRVNFGKNVADIVENLSNISSEKLEKQYNDLKSSDEEKYILKRMNYVKDFMKHLLAAVRLNILENLFLIKFFDRFHNMQTLQYHGNVYKQEMIAKETFDIYIPLFYMVQSIPLEYVHKMEDIAFEYMYPEIFQNRKKYIAENEDKIKKEVEFLQSYINQSTYKNTMTVFYQARNPYRLHLTKTNFSGINYAIYDIIIASAECKEDEEQKQSIENDSELKLIAEKRLYNFMVDLIHLPLLESKKKFARHYLIQNDSFKYSLNFHYSQAYLRPLPAMRINLYSNKNNVMFQLNLTTSNKLKEFERRRDIKEWVKTLKAVEANIVDSTDLEDAYEKLKVDFLKPVTLYTPKGDYIHIPHNATLRDFAFKIHTELGIKGSYALINQIEYVSLNESVKTLHGNIIEVITDETLTFDTINLSTLYAEVTLASSENKIDEYIKKHLKEKFGNNLSEEQLRNLSNMFKKEVEKKFIKRQTRY